MTEVAGLVLGAFPLLIEGLKLYAVGARTIGDMIEHDLILDAFRRDIEMEQTKLYDTYFQILEDMSVDPLILAKLENPESAHWQSPAVHSALEHRLRSTSFLQIKGTLKELHTLLQGLQKDFELKWNKEGTKPRMHQRLFRKWLAKFDVALNEDYRNKKIARIRQLNADIRLLVCGSISTSSGSLIPPRGNPAKQYGCIKKHAVSLYHTMKEKMQQKTCDCQDPHSVSLRLEMRNPNVKMSNTRFQLLFIRATTPDPGLYGYREIELECLDSENHRYLEHQIDTCQHLPNPQILPDHHIAGINPTGDEEGGVLLSPCAAGQGIEATKNGVLMKVMQSLTVPRVRGASASRPTSPNPESRLDTPNPTRTRNRRCRQVAFDNVPNQITGNTQPQSPEEICGLIDCFCSCSIINASLPNQGNRLPHHDCLGIMVNQQGDQRHRLRVPIQGWLTFQPRGTVSLDAILNSPTSYPTPTLRDRLKLGVNIASALMQLYESTWLSSSWGKTDILFPQGPNGPVFEMPLVHRVLHEKQTSPGPISKDCKVSQWVLALCNRSVFCLGVLLIELWHWKSFNELQAELRGGLVDDNSSAAEYITAQQLVQGLLANAGAPYGMPVKLCIMGLEHVEMQLELESFRNEVYKKIVYPLEVHLKNFCGVTDLTKIYQN